MDDDRGTGVVLTIIRTVVETGSTNADMLALARDGADEGWWLCAERQLSGRGRQGRAWASPAGNVYASTLVRLRAGDPPAATLAFVAAVALDETVSVFLPPDERARLAIKWPNDLMLGGAKLAGVLLERGGEAVVVGVGVNLAHHPELPDRRTTSLAAHGSASTPEAVIDGLGEAFARWLGQWRGEGLGPIRRRWLDRAHPIGTALSVRLPDGGRLEGLFDRLDPDGALVLRLAGGSRHVAHAGDVFLL